MSSILHPLYNVDWSNSYAWHSFHLAKALVLLSSNFLTPWCFYTLEICRRQFDLANREALDESAEWRMKYDEEVERSAKCDKQLIEVCIHLFLLICLLFLVVLHTSSLQPYLVGNASSAATRDMYFYILPYSNNPSPSVLLH